MNPRHRLFLTMTSAALALGAVAATPRATAVPDRDAECRQMGSLAEVPLPPFQAELLDLAFQVASKIPVDPHITDRSRTQEAVVTACLQLQQPRRALAQLEQIEDWRRGAAYADLAFYCARKGDTSEASHYLAIATQIADRAEDWRRDRIRAKLAGVHVLLGQADQAAPFETGLPEDEASKVTKVRAMLVDASGFEGLIKVLEVESAKGTFGPLKSALDACVQLFDRFYDDTERRSAAEAKIRAWWTPMPAVIRIELAMAMAGFALDHNDQATAMRLVDEARQVLETIQWAAEDRISLIARLAAIRHRAGDQEVARSEVLQTLSLFDAERENIASIFRANALRPIAEAYQSMGDTAAALVIYKRVVEEGADNKNARPRAEDLSATCRSMALNAVEPDGELAARIREISAGLSNPW